jgi:hypothetical protein
MKEKITMITEEKKLPLLSVRGWLVLFVAILLAAIALSRFSSGPPKLLPNGDPPILVGDGSIKLDHSKGVTQNSSTVIEVKKIGKATSVGVIGNATQVPLVPGWSLTSGGTPGFVIDRSTDANGNETYRAICPQAWTGTGSHWTCPVSSSFFPVDVRLPAGTTTLPCPNGQKCQLSINFR